MARDYSNSPKLEADDKGNAKVSQPTASTAGGATPEQQPNPVDDVFTRHERERKDMIDRHATELSGMHERHGSEFKKTLGRHSKEVGDVLGNGSGVPDKGGDKPAAKGEE